MTMHANGHLKLKVTNTFKKSWNTQKRIVINRGGTRSGKTYSVLQMIMLWLLTGRIRKDTVIDKGVCGVIRKYKSTMRSTVQRDFEEILKDYGVYGMVNHSKVHATYAFDGRVVEFLGADDEQKIRGYKSKILFLNEANELTYKKEFMQLLVRNSGLIFIDFNPSDPYVWINEELEQKRAHHKRDVEVIVSTYKDNRRLGKVQIEEIKYLQVTDPMLWQVYGLGQYGKVEGLVIPEVTIIEEMPERLRKRGAGLDFGFANDQTALIDGGVIPGSRRERERDKLYLDEWIYSLGMNDRDLVNRLNDLNFPTSREIYADSAQPGSIKEIKRAGYNAKAVKKFKNSIVFGINRMRQFDIYVTGRSAGLLKEQKLYKFKQHQNGDWLNEPIDAFNNSFDAARYMVISKLYNKKRLVA